MIRIGMKYLDMLFIRYDKEYNHNTNHEVAISKESLDNLNQKVIDIKKILTSSTLEDLKRSLNDCTFSKKSIKYRIPKEIIEKIDYQIEELLIVTKKSRKESKIEINSKELTKEDTLKLKNKIKETLKMLKLLIKKT